MQGLSQLVRQIRRPRLLVSAARIAAASYRGNRDLSRYLRAQRLTDRRSTVMRLVALEREYEEARAESSTSYNIRRHVEILAALISEAGALSRAGA